MSEDVVDWTDLREFRAVELTRSFVLTWKTDKESLLIDLDLCLAAAHALYERPRPAEGDCFRPAILEFPDCTSVTDATAESTPETAAVAIAICKLSHGRIRGLRLITDGEYELSGAFGTVRINADRPLLRLDGHFGQG
jgi:hypothetical protein